MVNPYRGEVPLTVNGETHRMRLTLGALAELEGALGEGSLLALVERFESGRFSAQDLVLLLTAGLRGGGAVTAAEGLAEAEIAGGPIAAAKAGATLLRRTFSALGEGG